MVDMESRVANFIHRHGLIAGGESLLVAVSGGADSVCLLHLLARCRDKLGVEIHVAHLNHVLRGKESDADAEYVSELARHLSLPFTIGKRDVSDYRSRKKCSLEEAARELRYSFLAETARGIGSRRIVVGHTRDDQVETILMHILRGAGISGLCGLRPSSSMIYDLYGPSSSQEEDKLLLVRPLLDVTREETQRYCQEHGLAVRQDSSNMSLSFLRNRLRLELLPVLRKYNPNVDEGLLRLADLAGEEKSFMEEHALNLWGYVAWKDGSDVCLDSAKVYDLPTSLQRQIIRMSITRVLGDDRDIELKHVDLIRAFTNKMTGKRLALPRGLACRTEYGKIILQTSSLPCRPVVPLRGEIPLEVPGKVLLPGWRVVVSVLLRAGKDGPVWENGHQNSAGEQLVAEFDLQQTGVELSVRQRQQGDVFHPLGMDMPKRLRRFMIDAKVPRSLRDSIPLVCARHRIIWVVGWRIDNRFKVNDATEKILRIEFIRAP